MRGVIAICTTLIVLSSLEGQSADRKKGSLYGTVLVIDPGHGGTDPGASQIFKGRRVVEDEYVYDVALRVERLAMARKAITFMTLRKSEGLRSDSPQKIFTDNRDERFASDGSKVRAGTSGLEARLRLGNKTYAKYPNHRRVWISIHFDVLGKRKDLAGVRIIHGQRSLTLARALEGSFAKRGRMRAHGPIAESGDDRYGLRNLYILSGRNKFEEKVLIELGNFLNEEDLWRIRDPKVREGYAEAIIQALENH